MSSVYRSRVLVQDRVVAILPTWSDGAAVRQAGLPGVTVQDGEWHGVIPGRSVADAPEPTHQSYVAVLAQLRGLTGVEPGKE